MDLVDYRQERYEEIRNDFVDFMNRLGGSESVSIPISALEGDFVTEPSTRMPWYTGPKLLEILESVNVDQQLDKGAFRFPIQLVSRPPSSAIPEMPDFRGYMGRISEGKVRVGDRVAILPKGKESTVTGIVTQDGPLQEAFARQSVTIMLADDIDISRGDLLASPVNAPKTTAQFKATLCWMNEHKLRLNQRYFLRLNTQSTRAIVNEIDFLLDVNTLERKSPVSEMQTNDIGQVRIKTLQPIVWDPYSTNRQTGGFIMVDDANDTVAAGMVLGE
jgi:sulfate adenylyltransferase subunit 1